MITTDPDDDALKRKNTFLELGDLLFGQLVSHDFWALGLLKN